MSTPPPSNLPATDRVLSAARPELGPREALAAASAGFGVTAADAVDLGSERDRTFALSDGDGHRTAILKISNAHEDPGILDMEAEAALWVAGVDPQLHVALPWHARVDGRARLARAGDPPRSLRFAFAHDGSSHWVRLYDVLDGDSRIDATALDDAALGAWGATAARLARALAGFTHPLAARRMLWDVQHAPSVAPMAQEIESADQRRLVLEALAQFERHAVPVWPRLRAQVLHTDLSVDNALTDGAGRITGIVDFGDMSYTALVADLASVLDSVACGREGEELFRVARLVLDGYERHLELDELELRTLPYAWAARSAVTIAISSWRAARGLEERAFAERFNAQCARVLEVMADTGWDALGNLLVPGGPRPAAAALAARRQAAFGPAMEDLFYDDPVDVTGADGVWISDTTGRRLLDAYNNVPVIGHGHPRVIAAIHRQSRQVNTHMRYLHPRAIELAERLVALSPAGLDTVMLVNSGSEANDVAWRMARAVTGNAGGVCTACAYHGITEATAALSPESWLDGRAPAHVETWAVPDTLRGLHLDGSAMAAALGRLRERGLAPAAAILDGLAMSDGVRDLGAGYVQDLVAQVRAAGGLWIADEVQAGHGRTGEAMWSYERAAITPDFVTLGKPMGNGHPVAAVITRREIAEATGAQTVLFSTFGGNPVSAAAALAVLDVIADERVLERVRDAGAALRGALEEIAARSAAVGEVRGVGLAFGVELVDPADGTTPDAPRAHAVREAMRREGVLVGATGPAGNVLKVRPPLAFTTRHVPTLAGALDAALRATA